MNRFASPIMMFLAFIVAGSVAKADPITPITYTIVDQGATYQNGWTLDGTITTDGTIGDLSQSNLLSGTLTLSSPLYGSYTATGITFTLQTHGSGPAMEATATPLTLLLPCSDPHSGSFSMTGSDGVGVDWLNPLTSESGYPIYGYDGIAPVTEPDWRPGIAWDSVWSTDPIGGYGGPPPPALGPTESWVIATVVPEPSTIVLLGIGAISMLVFAWRRRTRTA